MKDFHSFRIFPQVQVYHGHFQWKTGRGHQHCLRHGWWRQLLKRLTSYRKEPGTICNIIAVLAIIVHLDFHPVIIIHQSKSTNLTRFAVTLAHSAGSLFVQHYWLALVLCLPLRPNACVRRVETRTIHDDPKERAIGRRGPEVEPQSHCVVLPKSPSTECVDRAEPSQVLVESPRFVCFDEMTFSNLLAKFTQILF